ncbi:hypothetical protein BDV09DRAFT_181284 [Aspergillus tetrazonus]
MSSNPRASDRKARPESLRGRNSVLHSYVETESDRCQQAAYRLLNERQGNKKGRDWGSRCMKISIYFDNPSFRIQLFIRTLNKDIQREFARAPQAPLTLADAIGQAARYENILSRVKSRRKPQRGGHQSEFRRAYTSYEPPTYL